MSKNPQVLRTLIRFIVGEAIEKEKQKMDEKARSFPAVFSQWSTHPNPEYREWWINEARKYENMMPEAKEFLKKVCK